MKASPAETSKLRIGVYLVGREFHTRALLDGVEIARVECRTLEAASIVCERMLKHARTNWAVSDIKRVGSPECN